jgi:hypothetical protein
MVELTVDNFLTEKIFNDFNAQEAKSLEIALFIYFRTVLDIECPPWKCVFSLDNF